MRILIDECLDWRLGRALSGHDCVSVPKMDCSSVKELDVFFTADRNSSLKCLARSDRFAIVFERPRQILLQWRLEATVRSPKAGASEYEENKGVNLDSIRTLFISLIPERRVAPMTGRIESEHVPELIGIRTTIQAN